MIFYFSGTGNKPLLRQTAGHRLGMRRWTLPSSCGRPPSRPHLPVPWVFVSHLRWLPHFEALSRRPVFGQPGRLLCHDAAGRRRIPSAGPCRDMGLTAAFCRLSSRRRTSIALQPGPEGGPRHRGQRCRGWKEAGASPGESLRCIRRAMSNSNRTVNVHFVKVAPSLPPAPAGLRQMRRRVLWKTISASGRPPCVGDWRFSHPAPSADVLPEPLSTAGPAG